MPIRPTEQASHNSDEAPHLVTEKLTEELRTFALEYAREKNAPQHILRMLTTCDYIDGIISELRTLPDGQKKALEFLLQRTPQLTWFRGGSHSSFQELMHVTKDSPLYSEFSEEEWQTIVIDGGANGILADVDTALNFLLISRRETPVLYTVSLPALIAGLEQESIQLVSEHQYDLRIHPGPKYDWSKYLAWCREFLQVYDAEEWVKEQADKLGIIL